VSLTAVGGSEVEGSSWRIDGCRRRPQARLQMPQLPKLLCPMRKIKDSIEKTELSMA
jgi:hypothetical protein